MNRPQSDRRAVRFIRSLALLPVFGFALLAIPAPAAPLHVLLTVPAGEDAPATLFQQLSGWRQAGQASDILLLERARRGGAGFEWFIAVEFPDSASYERWMGDSRPGLDAPLVVTPVDVLTHGEKTPRDSNRSLFVVSEYQAGADGEQLRNLAGGYIQPLADGEIAARLLMRYTLYHEQGEGGRAWLVEEFRDRHHFEQAVGFRVELRKGLASEDPTFAGLDRDSGQLLVLRAETRALHTELPPPDLSDLPPYEPEFMVVGGLRILGSELKNAVDRLAAGFSSFHPEARLTTSHVPSSEGGIAGLYLGLSDVAPMGDDAKITDLMPFYNTFGYMPTEISVATGGYEKRGSLFAWAIVVHRDNPLNEISVDQLERIIGAERTGGWDLVEDSYRYSADFALGKDELIRAWGQLGLDGVWAGQEIRTFGYVAPGFAISIERMLLHWSHKYNPNFREYVEEKQAAPGSENRVASTVALEELSQDRYGLGIAAIMHTKNYQNIKILSVIPRNGLIAVPLTPDTVAKRSYPLIRDAYFYVNKPPDRPLDPKVREFMRFVLSREGQEIIAQVGYYYPLTADELKRQSAKLDP